MAMFAENMGVKVIRANAEEQFLNNLAGESDPEKKRKIIGRTFIDVFDAQSNNLDNIKYLAQGTIYPDVIESAGAKSGKAHVIKSHHNVGGLPEEMNLKLVEPCASCSRTKSVVWVWNWACRTTWSIATRSRARAWACGSSVK